jgi:Xaa-Pro aminopeptidase
MSSSILLEKIKQSVEILKEKDIDMWLTFVRESSTIPDPVMSMIAGSNVTWQSAFIICRDGDTAAIIGSLEEDKFVSLGTFKTVTGYLESVKAPLVDFIKKKDPSKIAINYSTNSNLADGLTHGMYLILLNHLHDTVYAERLISSEEIVSALKGRKSETELDIMQYAADETLKIYDEVTSFIKPGVTEIQIADFIKQKVKDRGYGLAWDEDHCPAVFTGPDTQGAHSGPTNRKVEKGHILTMDFGIVYKGYCSDLQRMWYILKDDETDAPGEVKKGFNIIKDSIRKVASALKPGVIGCEMDDIARNYITGEGYPEYPHGLGHQVGKSVHDGGGGLFPRWEKYGNAPYLPLEEFQVYTIEPRLPVEGYGTATMEEEVVITADGCRFISDPQEEIILIRG